MKIDDPIKKTAGLINGQTTTRAEKNNTATTNSAKPSGTVHLSALSSQLHVLEDQLSNNDISSSNKVEKIKLAIANGNFKINSDKVADRLIDTVKDLLHSSTKE